MRKLIFGFMLLLCLGVTGYALYAYFALPPGTTVHPAMRAAYEAHRWRILLHVSFSAVALLTGPFQFMPSVRRNRAVHRKIGYIYFTAVFVGGIAGLALALIAYGGLVSTLGFGSLAVLWLYTGYRALAAIRHKNYAAHEAWAVRNFALTFAAVTLRLQLGVGFATQLDFEIFYPAISWLCWVPNLIFAEWFLLPNNVTSPGDREKVGPDGGKIQPQFHRSK